MPGGMSEYPLTAMESPYKKSLFPSSDDNDGWHASLTANKQSAEISHIFTKLWHLPDLTDKACEKSTLTPPQKLCNCNYTLTIAYGTLYIQMLIMKWIMIFCLTIPTSNYLCIKLQKLLLLHRNQYISVFYHAGTIPLKQFTYQVVTSCTLWHNAGNSVTGVACSHILLLAVQQTVTMNTCRM